MSQLKKIAKGVGAFVGRRWPEQWVKFRYWLRFKKRLNLDNPKTLNEKILYLSLRTDTSKWTPLTDKYLVREYVKEKVGEDKLVKLYGKWENAKDIDFSKLPDKFVLKTNHGSGEIRIVKDKAQLNVPETIAYFNKEISHPYGEVEGGRHYWDIKPVIIAEELLENDLESAQYSSSIIDYKLWCFNGRCEYIFICSNRNKETLEIAMFDRNWRNVDSLLSFSDHYKPMGSILKKPHNLEELIKTAEKLAEGFPVVRVDLYNSGNKIYFGEMTFTSLGGMMNYFTDEFLNKAGEMITL